MTTVEVEISCKVTVPAKFKDFIEMMISDQEALPLQQWANEAIKQMRIQAAQCNMEVDEFLADLMAEWKSEHAMAEAMPI